MTILKWYSIILMFICIGGVIYDGIKDKEYGISYIISTTMFLIPILVYLFMR